MRINDERTCEKIFAQGAPRGHVGRLNRSKTSESLPTDSPSHVGSRDVQALSLGLMQCRTRPAMTRCTRRASTVHTGRAMPSGQRPSLLLRRSLTACGLALPPEAFITCPTNQPMAFGLLLACSTLSGLAATISSTTLAMAPTSV